MADLDLTNVRPEVQALAVIADGIFERLKEWHRLAGQIWRDRAHPMNRDEIVVIRSLARQLRRAASR